MKYQGPMWPREVPELQEILRQEPVVHIDCRGTATKWRTRMALPKSEIQPREGFVANLRFFRGIVDFSPADQVVTVRAGMRILELQKVLRDEGQCLPIGSGGAHGGSSVGGAISMNLPHLLEGAHGSWRDWVLGMKIVLADGSLVKTGSHAVKNVAGYDVHKLLIGARGTLGIVVEATLRTFPLAALQAREPLDATAGWLYPVIQRVRRSDFKEAVSRIEHLNAGDPETGTLWYGLAGNRSGPTEEPVRYPDDWLIRANCGMKNLEITDATTIRLMERAKEIFDPTHKLNPGEMGIF
ncbi:MAG TPA: FAD-binding oxidoreductase [Fimbriimonadaceae bacterium]|nr:FAD-binding oxidoreductase [Fimbriimonadaceae bacterium]